MRPLRSGGWPRLLIVAAQFIAPKTGSVHVSNTCGGLGVSSRTEAAALARRVGSPEPVSGR